MADLPMFPIDGELQHPPVCPGWLQRQPAVVEVAQAWRAFDKGCLGDVFPDPPAVLIEGLLLMDAEVTKQQNDERRKNTPANV